MRLAASSALLLAACNVITPDLLIPGDGAQVDAAVTGDGAPSVDASGPDLLLRYDFEEDGVTVNDSSPRALHGRLSDGNAWTAQGRHGRGLALAGGVPATQYVSLPTGVLAGVDDFTISVWVKMNSTTAWGRVYDIGNGLADPANRFMYLTPHGYTAGADDGIHVSSYGGSATNEAIVGSGTLLPVGVWKHLAVTGSGGDRTLYVDAFPVATLTNGPRVPPSEMEPIAPASWLGRSRFAADPGFDGSMDDFRIYNRRLTQAEIADLAWPDTDYAYWRFDEPSGATAADSSDFAIPATLFDGVTRAPGRIGGAVDFPGGDGSATSPRIVLGSSPFAGCTTQLTIAAWIKLRALTPWSRVFDFGSGNTSFIYLAPTDGAGMHFAMVSPAGLFDLVSPTPPLSADAQWHHVAVTVDAANLVSMYVDGKVVASATSPSVKPSDFTSLTENWLGRSRFGDPTLNGAIDELRTSCRAFTADEIRNLARK